MTEVQQSSSPIAALTGKNKSGAEGKGSDGEPGFSELLGHQVAGTEGEKQTAPQQAIPEMPPPPTEGLEDMPAPIFSDLIGQKKPYSKGVDLQKEAPTGDFVVKSTEEENGELMMQNLVMSAADSAPIEERIAVKNPNEEMPDIPLDLFPNQVLDEPPVSVEIPADLKLEKDLSDGGAELSAVVIPFMNVAETVEPNPPVKSGDKESGLAVKGETSAPVEQALSWDRLTSVSTQPELGSNIIPLMQAQAERVLNPLIRKEATPEELVLAALGEREGFTPAPVMQRPVVAMPDGMSTLEQMNNRVMRVEQLSSRFGEQVLSMVQQNEKVMKLTVHPAAMGELTVMVREENRMMTVEIHSQSEAVRELISRQEDSIRRLMQENNVEVSKFDVLLKDSSGERRQQMSAEHQQQQGRDALPNGTGPASEDNVEPKDTPRVLSNGAASWVA